MRLLWRGKFAGSKFFWGKYNYKLLYSKYGFRFLKFLFSSRYSSNILISDNPYLLNNFYFKFVSLILSVNYKLDSSNYNAVGHRLFNRGQPTNSVVSFERGVYWKTDKWNSIIKNISTKKREQFKRQKLIFNLYNKLKIEKNFKVKKNLYKKIKKLLIMYFSLRRSLVYKMKGKIITRFLRLFFRKKGKRRFLTRFYKKLIYKLRLKKKNFFLVKNSYKVFKSNKIRFNRKFKYDLNFNKLDLNSINHILNKNKYFKNENKKISYFVPKIFSWSVMYRMKLYSKYFSKLNYSYYVTDQKKNKFLRKSNFIKQNLITNKYSNIYLLSLEHYISMFLKKISVIFSDNLSIKFKMNRYYRLLNKFEKFIYRYLSIQNLNINRKLLCYNIVWKIHNWFLNNILVLNSNRFINNDIKFNVNVYLVKKMRLWIFFKFLQNSSLINNTVSKKKINYLKFNMFSNLKFLNWWFCYYSNNNIYNWFIKNLLNLNIIHKKSNKLVNFAYYYYYLNNIGKVRLSSFIFLYLHYDWYTKIMKKNKKFLIWF